MINQHTKTATRKLLEEAARRSVLYLDGIGERAAAPSPAAAAGLDAIDKAQPENPCDPAATLKLMDDVCSPATMAMAGPRFFGFVVGGSLPAALAANWLAGAWDQNAAFHNITPAAARLEQIALRWLLELLGLPPHCGGAFVTGCTMANFSALAAARHALLKRAGWNVEADGLFGAPEITVIIGEEAHPTLIKSLGLLGLGRNRVIRVPADSQGRMRAKPCPRCPALLLCARRRAMSTQERLTLSPKSATKRIRQARGFISTGRLASGLLLRPRWLISPRALTARTLGRPISING